MARYYKVQPSMLFQELDPYTAFCFDEACMYIANKIDNGEEPQFEKQTKEFKSFSEMYKGFT